MNKIKKQKLKKKTQIVIGLGICILFILLSIQPAIGQQNKQLINKKESPLFDYRINQAIESAESPIIKTNHIGKSHTFQISIPSIKKENSFTNAIDKIQIMDNEHFNNFAVAAIKLLVSKRIFNPGEFSDVKSCFEYIRKNPDEVKSIYTNSNGKFYTAGGCTIYEPYCTISQLSLYCLLDVFVLLLKIILTALIWIPLLALYIIAETLSNYSFHRDCSTTFLT